MDIGRLVFSGWIGVSVFLRGEEGLGFSLSHALAFQGNAVGVMNDATRDGVSNCGLSNHEIPPSHRTLGRDEERNPPITVLEDLQQVGSHRMILL